LRVTVLHNPTAGDAEHRPEAIVSALEEGGHDVEWQSTKEDDWEAALGAEAELFVIAGGDGTVQKVLRRLSGSDVPVTLLPVGSANNVARSLGFEDDDPGRLVRGWPTARILACDIGAIQFGESECRFVEAAGGGVFADVLVRAGNADHDLASQEKIEQGLRLLQESIAASRPAPWALSIDVSDLSTELIGVEVMNVRDVGPRVPLAPEADPGDRMLDVVLIRGRHAAALAAYVDARLERRSPEPLTLQTVRAREIAFRPPPGTPLHWDDEILTEDGPDDTLTVRLLAPVRLLVTGAGSKANHAGSSPQPSKAGKAGDS
jgi:diacylglycerol kinase (ATP)